MWYNYVKIALRSLRKFKGYASINIFGLAIGLACCLLIIQYLRDEWKVDKHHDNGGEIHRIATEFIIGNTADQTATTPSPLAAAIRADFPEVVQSARLIKAPNVDKYLLKYEDRAYFEEKGIYADSTLFQILTYDFVAGDPAHALDQPMSIVLSTSIAEKLFAAVNPIGQSIKVESLWGDELYEVTGVFDPSTYSSHIDAEFFLSMNSGALGRRFYRLQEWGGNNLFYTYLQLQPGTDRTAFEAKLPAWLEGYAGDRLRQMGFSKRHFLEPVEDIYLHSDVALQPGPTGDIAYFYILGSIALFILLIACINFMNLATAKATVRSQEVGVRKVIGASRSSLFGQFMSEAFVYTSMAVGVAFLVAEVFLPVFNKMLGKALHLNMLQDPVVLIILVGFVLLTTLVAGSYPALYLSSFQPTKIFRSSIHDRFSAQNIRKGLVVLQFIISIALIQGVIVINEQMNYVQNKNLGFNPEQKLLVPLNSPNSYENFYTLKEEVLRDSRVINASGVSSYPGSTNVEDMIMFGEGKTADEGQQGYMTFIEPDYLDLMEFELLEGRLFSYDHLSDTLNSIIVNEKLAKNLGYTTETAVGRKMFYEWGADRYDFTIVGVVKDFHTKSLHTPIEAQSFFFNPDNAHNYLIANVESKDLPGLLQSMESSWGKVNPEEPFQYYFLDQQLQQNYQADQRLGKLILWGTFLAIFISCLGLLGLATFAAERRLKEIGVRKVLGASVPNIIGLLTKDFLYLVLIALIIASPVAWYAMNKWFQNFHYHVDMPVWAYVAGGVMAIIIALATTLWQGLRAARINPIQSLRTE
ncbi:MAG: ABC transporter permease [Saprospiraceae bacterium]|nr:ABC transporter permease [Saprospiraceae bacterium]